jgi:NifU-like protein
MSCHHAPGGLQDILDEIWGRGAGEPRTAQPAEPALASGAPEPLSLFQRIKRIERVVEDQVRPLLKADGGDIEVIDIKENLVYCRLAGACAGCAGAAMTLKMMVERVLKEQVDEHIRVIAV